MVLITPRKDMIDNLHPMYKDIIKEYFTDGRNYYSADGSQSYPADQYYKTIEDDIKNRARLLPLTVSGGDVAWVVAQTAPTHYRLTLIDGGYLNPDDRIVTVNFHTIEPLHMVDLLDGKEFDISNPSSVTVDVPCGLFRFIDILTDGTVGIIDDYNENEEDLVIHEKLNKPDTETITTHHKSESLPEIEDESVSSTKQKTLRYAYIINNENTSPQSENISFVDSFNMSSQKIIEENGETGSIEAEPVLYASAENTTTENSPYDYKEQKTYTKPVKEESTILSEVNILDESLLGTIPTVKLYNKKDEVKKESIPVLPESKERKRAPIIGIIAATLLTSFGAMIMIKDQ